METFLETKNLRRKEFLKCNFIFHSEAYSTKQTLTVHPSNWGNAGFYLQGTADRNHFTVINLLTKVNSFKYFQRDK